MQVSDRISYKKTEDGSIFELTFENEQIRKGISYQELTSILGDPQHFNSDVKKCVIANYYIDGTYCSFYFRDLSGELYLILVDGGY